MKVTRMICAATVIVAVLAAPLSSCSSNKEGSQSTDRSAEPSPLTSATEPTLNTQESVAAEPEGTPGMANDNVAGENDNVAEAHEAASEPNVFPVEYMAYGEPHMITGFEIDVSDAGTTVIRFNCTDPVKFGQAYHALCEYSSGGIVHITDAIMNNGEYIEFVFDTGAKPEEIAVINGDTEDIIVVFNADNGQLVSDSECWLQQSGTSSVPDPKATPQPNTPSDPRSETIPTGSIVGIWEKADNNDKEYEGYEILTFTADGRYDIDSGWMSGKYELPGGNEYAGFVLMSTDGLPGLVKEHLFFVDDDNSKMIFIIFGTYDLLYNRVD